MAPLLMDVNEQNRRKVANLTARALEQGWSDDVLAARIQNVVGLDSRYALAVENFREGQIKAGLPPGKARDASRAYAKRLRAHRAIVVARSEVASALAQAQRVLWKQAQERGDLSRYAVRVTRLHKDDRLCQQCRGENGRRRSLKTTVGGPPFHPQCRCWEEVEDQGLVVEKIEKGKGRLDWSPKKNWVENEGGLPKYIEDIALALIRDHGMSRERAISVAISRCKLWAAGGGDVKADTRAKAAKAIAQWEKMKVSAAAKRAAK